MPGSGGYQIAAHNDRLIDVLAAGKLDVQAALFHGRGRPSGKRAGDRDQLNAVTDRRDRFVSLEKMFDDPHQVGVVA